MAKSPKNPTPASPSQASHSDLFLVWGTYGMPQVQDLLEEIVAQQGAGMGVHMHVESSIGKAAEVLTMDAVDSFLLGNRWGRHVAGLQPRFPVRVESFEKRFVD